MVFDDIQLALVKNALEDRKHSLALELTKHDVETRRYFSSEISAIDALLDAIRKHS